MAEENKSQVELINTEINRELTNETVAKALLSTTFKGLTVVTMKQAMMEGMIRGFNFKDFLERNVYAIPFKTGYSLVTSIDYARKRGMRAGIVGKSAPEFEEENGKLKTCSITVKRKVGDYIGEYTAKVYFDEYTTGNNLWVSKPRTMLAKVAEMHALRMACPEDLAQSYIEEELDAEAKTLAQKAYSAGGDLKMGKLSKSNENKETKPAEGSQDAEGGKASAEGK